MYSELHNQQECQECVVACGSDELLVGECTATSSPKCMHMCSHSAPASGSPGTANQSTVLALGVLVALLGAIICVLIYIILKPKHKRYMSVAAEDRQYDDDAPLTAGRLEFHNNHGAGAPADDDNENWKTPRTAPRAINDDDDDDDDDALLD